MTTPLVSIIIPCHNAQDWIAEALQSALAQTWPNTEIIVVDDGSTDLSYRIARPYESNRVKVISQENQGASSARNRGLNAAQGDYVQFLDADDLLARDKVEIQLRTLLDADSPRLVASCRWARFHRTISEAICEPQQVWGDFGGVDWLVASWEGGGMMHPAAWIAPRCVIETAGLWDEELSLNDDGEYFCRVLLASDGVRFCDEATTYYRSGNPTSLSHSHSEDALGSAFRAVDLSTAHLMNAKNNRKTRHACASAFQRFIYTVYPRVSQLRRIAEERVREFEGTDLLPEGGKKFHLVRRMLGWKFAKRLQGLSGSRHRAHGLGA